MNLARVCVLVLLAGTARAQIADMEQLRALSARWAEYYAAVYGVPVDLVEAIIDEESAWNPYAVSSKGAVGIMQLTPQTASRFGVHNRFRIDENIHGGVAYLAWLKHRFSGDLRLMTAAYYAGEYPISVRGLDYSSPDVERYVQHVSRHYRERRIARSNWRRQVESRGDRVRTFSIRITRDRVVGLKDTKTERSPDAERRFTGMENAKPILNPR